MMKKMHQLDLYIDTTQSNLMIASALLQESVNKVIQKVQKSNFTVTI